MARRSPIALVLVGAGVIAGAAAALVAVHAGSRADELPATRAAAQATAAGQAVIRSSAPASVVRSATTPPFKPATRVPTRAELDAAVCRSSGTTRKVVRVSIAQQRAWLCKGAALFLATPVTTGADTKSRRTHAGTWKIEHAWPNAYLSGAGYGEHVDWWMPYDGQFGLHDATWQKFPFGSAKWRTEGSHGCVHFPHAAMHDLFEWAPIGTTVTIVR